MLEAYLTNDYLLDTGDINEIDAQLETVVQAYALKFSEEKAWPYEVRLNTDMEEPDELSASTTSMILAALLRFYGYFKEADGDGSGNVPKGNVGPFFFKPDPKLVKNIKKAAVILLNRISNAEKEPSFKTISGTFGDDDVFTHAWLAEVCKADWGALQSDERWQPLKDFIINKAETRLDQSNDGQFLDMGVLFEPPKRNEKIISRPLSHAFTVLRLIQTIRCISGRERGPLTKYYGYFEKILHEQLSFSSIPDSRFDPAEMVFCLEGMLLSQKNIVDKTLFNRVLDVLASAQSDNAYWRPVKPYLATSQGLVLFPISVEVANSLLRCCAIIDGDEIYDTFGSRCIILLRRYWQWIRARAVKFSDKMNPKVELVGWHSEHVNEPTVIHLWETSQVMEFLLYYRNALHLHIARTTLVYSRFKVKKENEDSSWDTIERKYEPVLAMEEKLQVYKQIGKDFIAPRNQNIKDSALNYSMLLYGPPGTGKTTIAEKIALGLGCRLITITVSDFLADGGAQVEARAKNIFDVLMAQSSCVVLFDEIDHFLLNRDSEHYRQLDTVFQFMTPGMLTKINDLRRSNRVLFIISTNYEDRIDSAIKRVGRIDQKYLVLPPDKKKRLMVLDEHQTKINEENGSESYIFGEKFDGCSRENEIAEASVYLGFKDLETVVKLAIPGDIDHLLILLAERARTTSLESYKTRFVFISKEGQIQVDARDAPMAEFICLVALYLESKEASKMNKHESEAVKNAVKIIRDDMSAPVAIDDKMIVKYAPQLGFQNARQVADYFQSITTG